MNADKMPQCVKELTAKPGELNPVEWTDSCGMSSNLYTRMLVNTEKHIHTHYKHDNKL